MADTGGTIKGAAEALLEGGAKTVHAIVSHGLLSGDSMAQLAKLPIEKIVVTNTICQTEHLKQAGGKLEVMDISPVLAESIRRVSLPVPPRPSAGSRLASTDRYVVWLRVDAQRRVDLAPILGGRSEHVRLSGAVARERGSGSGALAWDQTRGEETTDDVEHCITNGRARHDCFFLDQAVRISWDPRLAAG